MTEKATKFAGRLADPEFRAQRARKAAAARHSLDTYINAIVARAPELTAEQVETLRPILSRDGGQ